MFVVLCRIRPNKMYIFCHKYRYNLTFQKKHDKLLFWWINMFLLIITGKYKIILCWNFIPGTMKYAICSILYNHRVGVRVMVFNATFNNIFYIVHVGVSFIGGENRSTWSKQPTCSHRHALSHNVVSSIHRLCGIRIHNLSGDRHGLHG